MPKLTADIAVIIPCFNHSDVLRRTLEAVYSQTILPKMVVVIDDASADQAAETISRDFESRLPIHFLRFRENRGAPAARNQGARQTSSEFLLFLDADAELIPTALEKYLSALAADPAASFAYANFYWGSHFFRSGPFDPDALKIENYIHTSSLIRRADFPGFDETLKKFQDWDLWLTMTEQNKRGVWVEEALYRIEPRQQGQGISSWLPSFMYKIPWKKLGWMPQPVRRYLIAKEIIKKKHAL